MLHKNNIKSTLLTNNYDTMEMGYVTKMVKSKPRQPECMETQCNIPASQKG